MPIEAIAYRDNAVLSDDHRYRYRLTRVLDPSRENWRDEFHLIVWLLLNPSKADAVRNDPTVRKMMGFSRQWGFRVMEVFNMFAWRSQNPLDLWTVSDPVGPENDAYLKTIPYNVTVVPAWGDSGLPRGRWAECAPRYLQRESAVKKILSARRAMCLGRTQAGSPRHPVRLAYATPLEVYS